MSKTAFETLQDIIRANGGQLVYGSEEDLARIMESEKPKSNSWVYDQTTLRAQDFDLSSDRETSNIKLIGAWIAQQDPVATRRVIMAQVRSIVVAIQRAAFSSGVSLVRFADDIDIDWSGNVLLVSISATITERFTT